MAFADDKTAVLNLVKANGCNQASYVYDNANTYAELINGMLNEFGSTFDCNKEYLENLAAIFADATLVANGVYYNKTAGTINNPKAIIKCTYTDVNFDSGVSIIPVQIFDSTITNITVSGGTIIPSLTISSGSTVQLIDVQGEACIDLLLIKACATFNSTVQKVKEGSCVKEILVDEDATFNGYTCELISL